MTAMTAMLAEVVIMTDMGNLSIRQVDDEVIKLLRLRAAENGVSMEEEARRALRNAVFQPVKLGALAASLFGADSGVDLEIPARQISEPPRFDP